MNEWMNEDGHSKQDIKGEPVEEKIDGALCWKTKAPHGGRNMNKAER